MHRSGLCALCLMAVLAACGADAPLPRLASTEIAAPPGADSGEPFLSSGRDRVYLSWLEKIGDVHELRLAAFTDDRWSATTVVASGTAFFVNWADFPSVTVGPDGSLWAHWLERSGDGPQGSMGYGVRLARSDDGGATWSEPWTPHADRSATEHGFVASMPVEGGMGFAWLDGRAFATEREDNAETALYFRTFDANGPAAPEAAIDPRVCDCCQTDAALAASGPVLVYRDRSAEEIRDIHVTRWVEGAWADPQPVHADGWETGACPVNGPAVDADGDRVAVAWFTAAEGVPRVKVAFSGDSAEHFGEPLLVDDGDPSGRVDVVLLADGAALVSWLERTEGEWADVRVRYVAPDGRVGSSLRVSASSSERASGFPRMARAPGNRVMIGWTDVGDAHPRVRVAMIELTEAVP